jgi:hypothetical protein
MSGAILSVHPYALMEYTVKNLPFWKNEIIEKEMGGHVTCVGFMPNECTDIILL